MFTWENAINRAKETKIRQGRRKALTNLDIIRDHPSLHKDAQNKNFVKIDAQIIQQHEHEVAQNLKRWEMLGKGKR